MGKVISSIRGFLGILFLAIFIYSVNLSVAAAEPGRIQVNCNTQRGGQTIYLAGDSYAIAFIAEAHFYENGGIEYSVCPDFSEYEYDWSAVNAVESKDMAKELEEYAKEHQLYFETDQTDESGVVQFTDLAPGVYLISRTNTLADNSGYTTDPVLVGIPSNEDGKQIYDVTVDLKFDWTDKSDTPSDPVPDVPSNKPSDGSENGGNPSESQNSGKVKTGDEARFACFIAICVGSMLCLYGLSSKKYHGRM